MSTGRLYIPGISEGADSNVAGLRTLTLHKITINASLYSVYDPDTLYLRPSQLYALPSITHLILDHILVFDRSARFLSWTTFPALTSLHVRTLIYSTIESGSASFYPFSPSSLYYQLRHLTTDNFVGMVAPCKVEQLSLPQEAFGSFDYQLISMLPHMVELRFEGGGAGGGSAVQTVELLLKRLRTPADGHLSKWKRLCLPKE